jgi:hypothetical protein
MNIELHREFAAIYRDTLARFETEMLGLAFAVAEKNINARAADWVPNDRSVSRLIARDRLFAKKGFVRESLLAA